MTSHTHPPATTPGSPYNGLAYCESFPRGAAASNTTDASTNGSSASPTNSTPTEYWAQVGRAAVSRSNFDNIGWSLLTVFQVLTMENWNDIMVGCLGLGGSQNGPNGPDVALIRPIARYALKKPRGADITPSVHPHPTTPAVLQHGRGVPSLVPLFCWRYLAGKLRDAQPVPGYPAGQLHRQRRVQVRWGQMQGADRVMIEQEGGNLTRRRGAACLWATPCFKTAEDLIDTARLPPAAAQAAPTQSKRLQPPRPRALL